MSGDEKQASWWTTLPGILTAIAAIITAVTGLVLGLGQLGVFDRGTSGGATAGVATSTSTAQPAASTGPTSEAAGSTSSGATVGGAGATGGSQATASGRAVTLPARRSYRSGDVEYEILGATARPDVAGQLAMEISIRCTNHGRYDINFWDANFRLSAGGVNIAPNSGLDELCQGDSSKTGTVRFVFPADVRDPVLRIKFSEGESTVPLQVAPV